MLEYDVNKSPGLGAFFSGQRRREEAETSLSNLMTAEHGRRERETRLGMDVEKHPLSLEQLMVQTEGTRESTRGTRFNNDVNQAVGIETKAAGERGKLSDAENKSRKEQFDNFMGELSRNGGDVDAAAEYSGVPPQVAARFRAAPPEVINSMMQARITRDPDVAKDTLKEQRKTAAKKEEIKALGDEQARLEQMRIDARKDQTPNKFSMSFQDALTRAKGAADKFAIVSQFTAAANIDPELSHLIPMLQELRKELEPQARAELQMKQNTQAPNLSALGISTNPPVQLRPDQAPGTVPQKGGQLSLKDKQAIKWAKENPQDPRAVALLKRLGL